MIPNAIFKLGYVRGINEFTAVEVLMELPNGAGATTEMIETHLNNHAADLKIGRTDIGTYRRVSA